MRSLVAEVPSESFGNSPASGLLVAVAVGVTTGILSSLTVWWALTHWLTSRLKWCWKMVKDVDATGKERLQIQVINFGRRAAVDVRVTVRMWVLDVQTVGVRTWFTVLDQHIPTVPAKDYRRFALDLQQVPESSHRELRMLGPGPMTWKQSGIRVPLYKLTKRSAGLEASVIASDEFSAARSAATRFFDFKEAVDGSFSVGSCEVIPANDDLATALQKDRDDSFKLMSGNGGGGDEE